MEMRNMNDDYGSYPAGRGHAWRGDWRARLGDLLATRGFQRLTEYAATRPTATLRALSDELGGGDVAPIQLQWMLVDEARATGQLERCARELLCRQLHELEGGWPSSRDWDVQEGARHALAAWQGFLTDERFGASMERITTALLDEVDLAAGWLPSSAEDPVIVQLFAQHWLKE
jgi:hypothetical protein